LRHAARALHEHRVAAAQQPAKSLGGRVGVGDRARFARERGKHVLRQGADGDEQIDPAPCRVCSELAMKLGRLRPELEHVTEHCDASSRRRRRELVDRRAH